MYVAVVNALSVRISPIPLSALITYKTKLGSRGVDYIVSTFDSVEVSVEGSSSGHRHSSKALSEAVN